MIEPTAETKHFWDELAGDRLVGRRCLACGTLHPYPRRFCPECGGEDGAWEELPGHGTVYSFTVVPRPPRDRPYLPTPLVLAIVELANGHRLMALLDAAEPAALRIGDAVRFRPYRKGDIVLPAFAPAAAMAHSPPDGDGA